MGKPMAGRLFSRFDFVLPLCLALSSLLWLYRNGPLFIFGEDSMLILHPFSYNTSPLIPYNYLSGSSIPFLGNFPYLYQDLLLQGIQNLTSDPTASQTILIIFWSGVACVGVWLLLTRLSIAWYGDSRKSTLSITLATVFYLVNPFSLTVIWWHWQGWTPFYCFLPLLSWLLVSIYLDGKVRWTRYLSVLIVGLVMAPGVAGTFAVSVAALCLIVALALACDRLVHSQKLTSWIGSAAAIVVLPVLLSGWSTIPTLLLPESNLVGGGYSANPALIQEFFQQGATTQAWRTWSLMGFSWVSNVPNAYPWGPSACLLYLSGAFSAAAFVAGALWIGKRRGLGVLYVVGCCFLVGAMGSSGPAEPVLRQLVELGGPFLIFVAPYYNLLEVYLVPASVALFLVTQESIDRLRSRLDTWVGRGSLTPNSPLSIMAESVQDGSQAEIPRRYNWRKDVSEGKWLWAVGLAVAVLVVAAPWAQVSATGIFQTQGPNVSAFELPRGYQELNSYFLQNYQGPNWFALILPLSFGAAVPLITGSGGFSNTFSLISSFIPYPTIYDNHTVIGTIGVNVVDQFYQYELPPQLMNWLAEANLSGIGNLLAALHVRYVVVDPYVDTTSGFVKNAPSGKAINWSMVFSALNRSLGSPASVGAFSVYEVPWAAPFVWVSREPQVTVASSFDSAMSLWALVSHSSDLGEWLENSSWSPASDPSSTNLVSYAINQTGQQWNISRSEGAYAVLENGSVLRLPDPQSSAYSLTYENSSNGAIVTLTPPILASVSNRSEFSTNMNYVNGSYQSPSKNITSLRFSNSLMGSVVIATNFSYAPISGPNWFTISMSSSSYVLWTTLFRNTTGGQSSLDMAAQVPSGTSGGFVSYGWLDRNLPPFKTLSNSTLTITRDETSLSASLTSPLTQTPVTATLYYMNRSLVELNPGYNLSSYPAGASSSAPFTLSISTVYPALNLTSFQVYRPTLVSQLCVTSSQLDAPISNVTLSAGLTGTWTVSVPRGAATESFYLTLAMPRYSAWSASSSSGSVSPVQAALGSNMFEIRNASTDSPLTITLFFSTWVEVGTAISIGELVGSGVILIAFFVRRGLTPGSWMQRLLRRMWS